MAIEAGLLGLQVGAFITFIRWNSAGMLPRGAGVGSCPYKFLICSQNLTNTMF